jgi:undecaprenyl-diphosphatase
MAVMDSLIIFAAKYLFLAVVLLWITAWLQASRGHKKQITAATAVAVVLAAIFDKISSKLYYDPRPFVTHHLHPLVAHAADNGFPSEHTLFSMTLAITLLFFRPKVGGAAVIIAVIVGIARVAAHVHSPIDIAAGALMGIIAGYIGYWCAMKYFPLKKEGPAKPGAGRPADPTE